MEDRTDSRTNYSFSRLGPNIAASPVVLSVPHAGRDYSKSLLSASRLSQQQLESLEDRYVDRLIWRAVAAGVTAIVARRPRAEIDLNRDERELDPTIIVPPPPTHSILTSARTRGGLGLIPARLNGSGSIWRRPIASKEVARRIDTIHKPYHSALAEALEGAHRQFGVAILLDCHSMPPRAVAGSGQAEVVFGDLHGTTIASDLLDAALEAARAAKYHVACNAPYAGGYITARHGRPRDSIHALQMEIDRSLYLANDLRSPGTGFERAAEMIAAIAQALASSALEPPQSIAAE